VGPYPLKLDSGLTYDIFCYCRRAGRRFRCGEKSTTNVFRLINPLYDMGRYTLQLNAFIKQVAYEYNIYSSPYSSGFLVRPIQPVGPSLLTLDVSVICRYLCRRVGRRFRYGKKCTMNGRMGLLYLLHGRAHIPAAQLHAYASHMLRNAPCIWHVHVHILVA